MSMNLHLVRYFAGLAAVFSSAWLTEATGSLIPLALGGSVALMCTASVVKRLWSGNRK